MSYATAGRRIYCPKCGTRVGSGAADAHLLACDETDQAAEAADWQSMDVAPKDGAVILTQAKNMGGCWMEPGIAWWAANTAAPEPWITHFWANGKDLAEHPIPCYHQPLRWRPFPPALPPSG